MSSNKMALDALTAAKTQLEILLPDYGRVHDETEALAKIDAAIAALQAEGGRMLNPAWLKAHGFSSAKEYVAAQAPVVQASWPQEEQPDGTVNAVDPADMGASSGAAQAVRMLTQEELEHCRLWYDGALNQQLGVLRKFCAVNAGRTIPADGVIGGV